MDDRIKTYTQEIKRAKTSQVLEAIFERLKRDTALPYDIRFGLLADLSYKIQSFSAGVNGVRI